MSVSYRTQAVIGVEIDVSKLRIAIKKRGCRCSTEALIEPAFCPNCGRPWFVSDLKKIPEFDEAKDTLCGFSLFYTTDQERAFCGSGIIARGDGAKMAPIPPSDLMLDLSKALIPLGLWDINKYGLWAVQYCSY